jgi:hypothetical protein
MPGGIDSLPQGRRPQGRRGESAEAARRQRRQVADTLRPRFAGLAS